MRLLREAVWSGYTLFAQTCLSENFGSLLYNKSMQFFIGVYTPTFGLKLFESEESHPLSQILEMCILLSESTVTDMCSQ